MSNVDIRRGCKELESNRDCNVQQMEQTTHINVDLTNCPEQRQISTVPIPTTITKSNPVFPGLVHKLNLPLIEFPKSINNTERKDQHNTLKSFLARSPVPSHPSPK